MSKKLITAPAVEPVTLAEAKLHCHVDISDDDALITSLIVTARNMAEERLGRALISQTWEQIIDAFPSAEIKLPFPNVQSIESVKYVVSDVQQTLSSTAYSLDSEAEYESWLFPVTDWPDTDDAANAVRIRFVVGYGDAASDVPEPIRQWMLLQIGHFYDQRSAASDRGYSILPYVESLIDPYKVW